MCLPKTAPGGTKKQASRQFSTYGTSAPGGWTTSSTGDDQKIEMALGRGVPEGSPLSPCLFNLFVDTLGQRLLDVPRIVSAWPANIFADDVKLVARTWDGLQELLHNCTTWAHQYGMKWAPTKSHVLLPESHPRQLTLAGQPLQRRSSVTYLGVEISAYGIESDATRRE